MVIADRFRSGVAMAVLLLIALLLWAPRLRGPVDLRFDAGVYYVLGTSLAEGRGYRLLNEPGEIQAIQYPPLLPLFVAAHQRVAGTSDPAIAGHLLRLSYFALSLAFIAAVYLLGRHVLTPGWAFLATLLVLLHVQTTWMSELLFAELPFALASVLFLLAVRAKGRLPRSFAGLLAVSCFLLRSTGIAVLAAWVLESVSKRRFKEAAVRAAIALVPVVGWQAYIGHVTRSAEYARPAYEYQRAGYQNYNVSYVDNVMYVDPFQPELGKETLGSLLRRFARNVTILPEYLGGAVSVSQEAIGAWRERIAAVLGQSLAPASMTGVPLVFLGALVLCGVVVLAVRGEVLTAWYVVGSCGLSCLTPWSSEFTRYLWPLTPLLAIALITTVVCVRRWCLIRTSRRWRGVVTGVVVALSLGVVSAQSYAVVKYLGSRRAASYRDATGQQHEYALFSYDDWPGHDAALDWLRAHSGPRDVVATSTPHWAYLRTGLRSVYPPFEPQVDDAQRLLESVPARYLIVDSLVFRDYGRRYTDPVVRAFPDRWELVYTSVPNGSAIYRRTGADASEPRQQADMERR